MTDEKKPDKDSDDNKSLESKLKESENQIAELKKSIEALKFGTKPTDGKSLNDVVIDDNKAKEQKAKELKCLEAACKFNINSDKFISNHKDILGKEIADIFAVAAKEKFDSEVDKSNATKAAIIQSFFSLQANLDSLTDSHKSSIEDFMKLTKRSKEERASEVFENIFEPCVDTMKRLRKAEEVVKAKSGYANSSDVESKYKERLILGSRKHFLGEK
jgi:hypothetical protein